MMSLAHLVDITTSHDSYCITYNEVLLVMLQYLECNNGN